MDKQFIVAVLATNSSDYLKASILNAIEKLDLDVTRMKLAPGMAADAFAKAKAAKDNANPIIPTPLPPPPNDRISAVELKPMPASIKFEDVEKHEVRPVTVPAVNAQPEALSPSEQLLIDGKEYVTIQTAAILRNISVASAYSAAMQHNWLRQRHPKIKRTVYLKDDVVGSHRGSKESVAA